MSEAKKEEHHNAFVMERGQHGLLGMGASFVAGALDPINLASAFVPVIPEARAAAMIYANKGMAGAFMTRVKTGAASGFAGALMVEPIIHTSQDQLQADYTMFNSVMNLGFGAALFDARARARAWDEKGKSKIFMTTGNRTGTAGGILNRRIGAKPCRRNGATRTRSWATRRKI